jgi:hypothetical protein
MLRTAEESTPCALSTKTKPDSRGLDPAIHVFGRSKRKDTDAREFFLEDALRAFALGMRNRAPQFVTSSR